MIFICINKIIIKTLLSIFLNQNLKVWKIGKLNIFKYIIVIIAL